MKQCVCVCVCVMSWSLATEMLISSHFLCSVLCRKQRNNFRSQERCNTQHVKPERVDVKQTRVEQQARWKANWHVEQLFCEGCEAVPPTPPSARRRFGVGHLSRSGQTEISESAICSRAANQSAASLRPTWRLWHTLGRDTQTLRLFKVSRL